MGDKTRETTKLEIKARIKRLKSRNLNISGHQEHIHTEELPEKKRKIITQKP